MRAFEFWSIFCISAAFVLFLASIANNDLFAILFSFILMIEADVAFIIIEACIGSRLI